MTPGQWLVAGAAIGIAVLAAGLIVWPAEDIERALGDEFDSLSDGEAS